ncbi:hypothetical protein FACS1894204_12830 [Synergistales bacterium]|nr:hypothetical protein FACS1894204_12830 [Synergistales bacterium]
MQYTQNTAGTSKLIGRLFNVSPMKVEHFIRGVGGGLGADLNSVAGALVDKWNGDTKDREARYFSEYSPLRRFTTNPTQNSQYVDDFYTLLGKSNRDLSGLKAMVKSGEKGDVTNAAKFNKLFNEKSRKFSEARAAQNAIRNSKDFSPQQKREKIDILNEQMNKISRLVLAGYDKYEKGQKLGGYFIPVSK